jgi:hypothetical protein
MDGCLPKPISPKPISPRWRLARKGSRTGKFTREIATQPIGSSRFGDALRQDYGAIAPYQSMRSVGTISAFEFRSSSYGREQRPPARSRVRFTPTDLLRRWHGHDLLGRMQRAPARIFFYGANCSPVQANAGRKSRKLLIPAANHGCCGETRGAAFSTGLCGGYRADIKLSCDCNNRGLWPQRAPKEWRRETIFPNRSRPHE